MNYRPVLTSRAERDRDKAYAWHVENYSFDFAARWYSGLTEAVRSLQQQPLRCPKAHESDEFLFEVRELLFGRRRHKHRILFTVENDRVLVLHIRHSAQRDLTADDL